MGVIDISMESQQLPILLILPVLLLLLIDDFPLVASMHRQDAFHVANWLACSLACLLSCRTISSSTVDSELRVYDGMIEMEERKEGRVGNYRVHRESV